MRIQQFGDAHFQLTEMGNETQKKRERAKEKKVYRCSNLFHNEDEE